MSLALPDDIWCHILSFIPDDLEIFRLRTVNKHLDRLVGNSDVIWMLKCKRQGIQNHTSYSRWKQVYFPQVCEDHDYAAMGDICIEKDSAGKLKQIMIKKEGLYYKPIELCKSYQGLEIVCYDIGQDMLLRYYNFYKYLYENYIKKYNLFISITCIIGIKDGGMDMATIKSDGNILHIERYHQNCIGAVGFIYPSNPNPTY